MLEVVEEQKLGYNPPHLVMIFDTVIVCSGCKIPFKTTKNQKTLFLNT